MVFTYFCEFINFFLQVSLKLNKDDIKFEKDKNVQQQKS